MEIDNGTGSVDFDIESGLFTAVRTVNVSDLEDSLEIAAAGGLAPILSQNQANELEGAEVKTSLIWLQVKQLLSTSLAVPRYCRSSLTGLI